MSTRPATPIASLSFPQLVSAMPIAIFVKAILDALQGDAGRPAGTRSRQPLTAR